MLTRDSDLPLCKRGKSVWEAWREQFHVHLNFEFAVSLKQSPGTDECLIIGGLDRFFEVVLYLKIVALARLQRQSLGFCLKNDRAIAKYDESVYLPDLVSFSPFKMDI